MTYSINLDADGGENITLYFDGAAIAGGSPGFVWIGEAEVQKGPGYDADYDALRKVFWSMYQTALQHGTLDSRFV